MSLRAPFVDAARSIDPTNNANTFVSYYPYGAMIGLALDLMLRTEFEDITLDDYMKLVWTKFGKTEIPYTNQDLRNTLAELTGNADFATRFFESYVYSGGMPDYAPLFEAAGLRFGASSPDAAWIGAASLTANGEHVVVSSATRRGSPLYTAGLDNGDEILQLGDRVIRDKSDLDAVIASHAVGDVLPIAYRQRGTLYSSELTLAVDPSLELTFMPEPTNAQIAFRADWIGTD